MLAPQTFTDKALILGLMALWWRARLLEESSAARCSRVSSFKKTSGAGFVAVKLTPARCTVSKQR
jgi:hypothetical protein